MSRSVFVSAGDFFRGSFFLSSRDVELHWARIRGGRGREKMLFCQMAFLRGKKYPKKEKEKTEPSVEQSIATASANREPSALFGLRVELFRLNRWRGELVDGGKSKNNELR